VTVPALAVSAPAAPLLRLRGISRSYRSGAVTVPER
jgi:hypothetical protein